MLLPRPRSWPNERRILTLNLDEKPVDPHSCQSMERYRLSRGETDGCDKPPPAFTTQGEERCSCELESEIRRKRAREFAVPL